MPTEGHKTTIRKQVEHRRSSLTAEERAEKQEIINQKLIALCQKKSCDTVMGYMPFRTEIELTSFLTWCWGAGIHVWLPRMVPSQKSIEVYEVYDDTQVQANRFGIIEPVPEKCRVVSENEFTGNMMIVVPGLAFDRNLARLGYGGGYYDRFLQTIHSTVNPLLWKVSVAFDVQLMDTIPMEPHDVYIDCLLTESKMLARK